jgi:hypothetical protein
MEQLETLLNNDRTEETAYEALQLAQSVVRKKIKDGHYDAACELCYSSALKLLQQHCVSVASQLLTLLAEVLRETHTLETNLWMDRFMELDTAHDQATRGNTGLEASRLQRLQRSWLSSVNQWSSELGTTKYGNNRLQELLRQQCWKVSTLHEDYEDDILELQCDAVQHMALAERSDRIIEWLQTLEAPTTEQTKAGHECTPAIRDMLLTRAVMLMCAVENLRDANVLLREYTQQVEQRDVNELARSYTNKEDGLAP